MDEHERFLFLEFPTQPDSIPGIAREFEEFCKRSANMTPEELLKEVAPKKPYLRDLTHDDIPHLIDIDKDAFPDDPYDAKTFKHWLGQGGGYAIDDGGRPVAYALHRPVKTRPDFHYVQSIATHKDHRRKGYASQLLDRIKQLGKGVTLDVRVTNKPARALYKKHGFEYEDTVVDPNDAARVGKHLALKMAFDIASEDEARQKLPYRDRAEMYAMKDGKLYGSVYGDSSAFGVYGGGIDPGENPLEAAAREFAEESGWQVKNPRLLPFDPHLVEWTPPYASAKQKERAKQYRGSRTFYVMGDLGDQIPNAKLDELGRKNAGLWNIDDALKLVSPNTEDAVLAAANGRRAEILNHLKAQITPTPIPKSAFDRYVPQLVIVKRAADDATPFTIAIDLDGTLAKKEEPFSTKSIGQPRERAVYWARLFHQAGARIIIFTVRGSNDLVAAWLKKHKIPYDHINENPDQPEGSSGKVIADAYWDDRGFNAEDPDENGPEILRRLLAHGKEDKEEEEHSPAGTPSMTVSISRTTYILAAPEILDALEHTHGEGTGNGDEADDGIGADDEGR